MPLEDIARNTRIATAYLRAIEDMDFRSLPGGVYNISYIRQYARAVGVNEDEMVSAYLELTPEARAAVQPPTPEPLERVAAWLWNVWQKAQAAIARLSPR